MCSDRSSVNEKAQLSRDKDFVESGAAVTDVQFEEECESETAFERSRENTFEHPKTTWRQLPPLIRKDPFGYGRNPAFWFTLNYPYNYLFELHRFQNVTREA